MQKREIPSRIIDLIGVIDDKMLYEFAEKMRAIHEYDMELYDYNSKLMKEYRIPYEPIRINLSTPGGSVHAGTAIMGIMDEAIAPIHVHVMGSCMSMGISILAHANNRSATKFSSFMIHGMSTGTYGYLDEGVQSLDYYKQLEKDLNVELTKRTKYTLEELESYSNVAHFFGYEEALAKGLLTQDVYDTKPKARFSRKEFEEVIMEDLEGDNSIDDIMDMFAKDELNEAEWDIVLDILSEVEKDLTKDDILRDEDLDDIEDINEIDVDDNPEPDFIPNDIEMPIVKEMDASDLVEPEPLFESSIEHSIQDFLLLIDKNFIELSPYLQGDYTADEIAFVMQSMIPECADMDSEVIVTYLLMINEAMGDDNE